MKQPNNYDEYAVDISIEFLFLSDKRNVFRSKLATNYSARTKALISSALELSQPRQLVSKFY
jgi:hypothetical protein